VTLGLFYYPNYRTVKYRSVTCGTHFILAVTLIRCCGRSGVVVTKNQLYAIMQKGAMLYET
jgi:hypothetical protein